MKTLSIGLASLSFAACALADGRPVTILADAAPGVELTVPQDAKVTPLKEKTVIQTADMFLHVWPVQGAGTLDDAQLKLADVVKGDVLKFSASTTNALTVAGAPARLLSGKCVEADDGDPAAADVVLFAVGDRVYVACVHGEGNDASRERAPMLEVLRTAKRPPAKPAGQ